ncbi:hypothetical protein OG444_04290 [Streptomyces sp. NBC_01232]|uniref:hypothetical protein n=1 Tax=Streptomyces sp. NBC_01232 TaxID=2903786 RepID=UPI002E139241|nr:hypothetical protein OG444_04290 [Streptomyces sp. NBC_01232]
MNVTTASLSLNFADVDASRDFVYRMQPWGGCDVGDVPGGALMCIDPRQYDDSGART